LRTDGTNCDKETAYACELAGGLSELVHINQLRGRMRHLRDYQFLVIPGGFSYGDDIASGKILANELAEFFAGELTEFVGHGKLVLGICNGFQILIRSGLLPMLTLGTMKATLAYNTRGNFECRMVDMVRLDSPCVYTRNMDSDISLPVAHGEGRFEASDEEIRRIEDRNQVVLRYASKGLPTHEYPANPNGSRNEIAGICDVTGRIFGLMPHPERFVEETQHPNWRRMKVVKPFGRLFFDNAIQLAGHL
jgi:phosphoribosylformylglycinamidine synthase